MQYVTCLLASAYFTNLLMKGFLDEPDAEGKDSDFIGALVLT